MEKIIKNIAVVFMITLSLAASIESHAYDTTLELESITDTKKSYDEIIDEIGVFYQLESIKYQSDKTLTFQRNKVDVDNGVYRGLWRVNHNNSFSRQKKLNPDLETLVHYW